MNKHLILFIAALLVLPANLCASDSGQKFDNMYFANGEQQFPNFHKVAADAAMEKPWRQWFAEGGYRERDFLVYSGVRIAGPLVVGKAFAMALDKLDASTQPNGDAINLVTLKAAGYLVAAIGVDDWATRKRERNRNKRGEMFAIEKFACGKCLEIAAKDLPPRFIDVENRKARGTFKKVKNRECTRREYNGKMCREDLMTVAFTYSAQYCAGHAPQPEPEPELVIPCEPVEYPAPEPVVLEAVEEPEPVAPCEPVEEFVPEPVVPHELVEVLIPVEPIDSVAQTTTYSYLDDHVHYDGAL